MKKQIEQPGKKDLREFALVTGALVVVLFGLLLPWLLDGKLRMWPWMVTGVLWAWALILPMSLRPVYRVWMAIGHMLGWVNTRIILGIMFYALFLPIGLVMKLLGKDPMARKIDKSGKTYRITHVHPKRDHVERPY